MTNKKTFTKIRKWAEAKGYEVKDSNYFNKITVTINEKLSFTIDQRESTIYHSIRGRKGNAAGIYMAVNHDGRSGYGFQQRSQKEMIEKMEQEIKKMEEEQVEVETTVEEVTAEEVELEVEVAVETTEEVKPVEEKTPMKILDDRKDIAQALNFGKYPVLTYDLDTNKGSKARVNSRRGDFHYRCELFRGSGILGEQGGEFYLLTKPSVLSSSFTVEDAIEQAEYANAPVIEPNQEVAILVYSKSLNIRNVVIVKSGRIDGMCATATTFKTRY